MERGGASAGIKMNHAPDNRSPVWILIEWVVCLALAGVFIAAALPKISNPDQFALAVYQYRLLPSALVNVTAIYIPWLEVSCAAALAVLPSARRGTLLVVGAMLVAFTLAIALVVLRGQVIPCGCFGSENSTSAGWLALLRNCGLLALAALALRATR